MSEEQTPPIEERKQPLSPEELLAKKRRKEERRQKREEIEQRKKSNKNKKNIKLIGGLTLSSILLLFVGLFFYSPYYQVKQLITTLEQKKYSEMGRFVDQEKIGEHYNLEFEKKMKQEVQEKVVNGQFTWLGEEMAPIILEREIGKYSTPKAVMNTILNGYRTAYNEDLDESANGWEALKNSNKKYLSLNEFNVYLNEKEKPLNLTFKRYGIFSWKVVRIDWIYIATWLNFMLSSLKIWLGDVDVNHNN